MMRSIRWRLLAGTIAGMVGLLVLFGVVVHAAASRALVKGFNAALAATARALAGHVEQERDGVKLDREDLLMPEFERSERPDYFQLWFDSGEVLARSPSLGMADLPRVGGSVEAPGFRAVTLPNGRPGRAAGFVFLPKVENQDGDEGDRKGAKPTGQPKRRTARPQGVMLVVARESSELESQLRFLRWLLIGSSAGAVVLALVTAWVVVGRGLRPLNTLAAEIAEIRAARLDARVGTGSMPAELVPVVERLNDLLARLEAAFERERSFTADVAHELRTPLAGLRAILEVNLSRSRGASEYKDALAECLAVGKRMQAMVENLLILARLDAGQVKLRPAAVRLRELVESSWRVHADKAAARGIIFENAIPPDLTGAADPELLATVIANLLANAAEYTDDGGRISVAGQAAPARVVIANTGCRLPPDAAPHLFDRFWRGDPARAGTGAHCGLGLALVHRAMTAMGGAATARVDGTGLFEVTLALPEPRQARPAAPLDRHV